MIAIPEHHTSMSLFSRLFKRNPPEFAVGQIWAYQHRPGESRSTLQICQIDDDARLGRIFHISVFQVQIPTPGGGLCEAMPHLPVSLETLQQSVTTWQQDAPVPGDYREGYQIWREAFDQGDAGIFTLSVAEILDITARMAAQGHTA